MKKTTRLSWAFVAAMILSSAWVGSAQAVLISGQWHNTTFNTFAPASFDLQFTPTTYSVTMDLDAGPNGAVFGGIDPPPFNFSGNFEPDGSVIVNIPNDPMFGTVTGTISPLGVIDITATDIPNPFAPSFIFGDATVQGTFDGTSVNLNYEIIFDGRPSSGQGGVEGSDYALGVITGTAVVPEPASLVLLGMGGLAWLRRRT